MKEDDLNRAIADTVRTLKLTKTKILIGPTLSNSITFSLR
jgi:hypothetical protein